MVKKLKYRRSTFKWENWIPFFLSRRKNKFLFFHEEQESDIVHASD
jgi:hypothetical protein